MLFEHIDVDKLLSYEAYKDFSVDDYRMIIDEAMKVAQEVLGPAMQGCVYEDGRITGCRVEWDFRAERAQLPKKWTTSRFQCSTKSTIRFCQIRLK